MVMAVFSHLYITNFVRNAGGSGLSLGQLLLHIQSVSNEELLALYGAVARLLVSRGLPIPR
jgi:hypothetical protein